MRIGIDLDGVLVDFVKSYNALVKAHLGIELPAQAGVWDYHLEAGMTKKQADQMWEVIKDTPFHGTMLPLPGALEALDRLNLLNIQGNDIYFITTRSGKLAKFYSEMWLRFHGMDHPTVLISFEKGPVAKGLKLDVFVDDKPENNNDVLLNSPKTRVYLIDQLYNQWALDAYGIRIGSLGEVLDLEFPSAERRAA